MSSAGARRVGSGGASKTGARQGARPGAPGRSPASSASKPKAAKPSDKLNPKTIDPFNTSSRGKSAFAQMYINGAVPCRLVHGSVKHSLQWTAQIDTVPYDPVLITLAEGIKETVHPYSFVARQGFSEMLDLEGATYRVEPLLPKLAQPIRGALGIQLTEHPYVFISRTGFKELLEARQAKERASPLLAKLSPYLKQALGHTDGSVFEAGLDATVQLSNVVGTALNPQLKSLMVPISKRMMDKKFREKVTNALNILEENGGKDALLAIKSKIPTYQTINF